MCRFIPVLTIVCMVTIASFSIFEDSHAGEVDSEKPRIPGWFRVDTDSLGTHFLIGATHSVGGVSLESNIYIDDTLGEFDLGVSIPAVKGDSFSLTLLPMLGLGFDYKAPDGPPLFFHTCLCFCPPAKSSSSRGRLGRSIPCLMRNGTTKSIRAITSPIPLTGLSRLARSLKP